jgi:hypothetical protein
LSPKWQGKWVSESVSEWVLAQAVRMSHLPTHSLTHTLTWIFFSAFFKYYPHFTVNDLDWQRLQARALAGSADAQAGQRFIGCIVRLADEMLTVAGEELSVAEIQRERQVTADVFVRDQLSIEAGEEAFARPLAGARVLEFTGGALGQFFGTRNFDLAHG